MNMVYNMNVFSGQHNGALETNFEQLTGRDVISVTIIRNVGGHTERITLDPSSSDFRSHLVAMRRFEGEQINGIKSISFNLTGARSMVINDEKRINESIQEWLQLTQDMDVEIPGKERNRYIVATLFDTVINQRGNPAPSLIETIEDFAVAQGIILANTANQPWLITKGLSLYLGIPHEDAEHLTNYWIPRLNPVYCDQVFRPSSETRDFNQFHRDLIHNMLQFINDPESVKKGWKNVDSSTFLAFTSMAAVGFMRKYPSLNVEGTKLAETLEETFKDPKIREQLSEAFDIFTSEVSMFQSVFEVMKEELDEKGDGEIAETTSNLNEALKNVNKADKEIVNEITQDLLPLVKKIDPRKVEKAINTLEECAKKLSLTDVEFYLSSEAGYTDTDTDTMPRLPQGEIEREPKSKGKSTKVWLSEKVKELTENPKNVQVAAKVYRRTKKGVKAFPSSVEKAVESGRNLNPSDVQLALADLDGGAVAAFIVDSESNQSEQRQGIFESFWSGLGRAFTLNSSESNRSHSPTHDDDSGYSESSSSDEGSSVNESSSSDEESSVNESSSSDEESSVNESSSSDEESSNSEGVSPNHSGDESRHDPLANLRFYDGI